MYATVRESTITSGNEERAAPLMQEFQQLRARQPGYRGSVTVDAGEGRMLILSLWDSEEQAAAAARVLEPEAERLMGDSWTGPPRILGAGTVRQDDLSRA